MVRRGLLGLFLLLSLNAVAVWAREDPSAPEGQDRVDQFMLRHNLHPAFEKLGRGVSNALLGWTEIPLGVQQHSTPTDAGGSFITGAAHGVVKGLVRTGVGLYETVTFFLPYPEHYAPILPTLAYFKRSPRHEPLPLE